jgi:8-amino-7-oxononanoate synthase
LTGKKKSNLGNISQNLKAKLTQTVIEKKIKNLEKQAVKIKLATDNSEICTSNLPNEYAMQIIIEGGKEMGIANPFFKVHEGIANNQTTINNQNFINFANYNYLGFNGRAEVSQAAMRAIEQYGTSVSASRPVAGERPIQQALEQALAEHYQVDDAILYVSGHATNVTTIGYLFNNKDLILHDALIHNSVLQGIQLSGAKRMPFAHNDWQALEQLLLTQRQNFDKVLIVIEGLYSMDGDYPDLPKFIEIKQRYNACLMVDEAHSLGVLGEKGYGIREHFNLAGTDVDIWMGTLSKTLASCGGYIAGKQALIQNLKYFAPGFLYSVGIAPPLAAAALEALQLLHREPEKVKQLRKNGQLFLKLCQDHNINTGKSAGLSVIPTITKSSIKAGRLSNILFKQGINVQPIFYPAVEEGMARLRFFISSEHTEEQIKETVQKLAYYWNE